MRVRHPSSILTIPSVPPCMTISLPQGACLSPLLTFTSSWIVQALRMHIFLLISDRCPRHLRTLRFSPGPLSSVPHPVRVWKPFWSFATKPPIWAWTSCISYARARSTNAIPFLGTPTIPVVVGYPSDRCIPSSSRIRPSRTHAHLCCRTALPRVVFCQASLTFQASVGEVLVGHAVGLALPQSHHRQDGFSAAVSSVLLDSYEYL